MRVVIQRVSYASVTIHDKEFNYIDKGLLIFLGIEVDDNEEDVEWLVKKIHGLRIFNDQDNKMNLSIEEIQGSYLVISQFTLHASTKKGNRPSYIKAARPDLAIPMYENFIQNLERVSNRKVKTGIFGEDMKVNILNDGPVTIWIDTKNKE